MYTVVSIYHIVHMRMQDIPSVFVHKSVIAVGNFVAYYIFAAHMYTVVSTYHIVHMRMQEIPFGFCLKIVFCCWKFCNMYRSEVQILHSMKAKVCSKIVFCID